MATGSVAARSRSAGRPPPACHPYRGQHDQFGMQSRGGLGHRLNRGVGAEEGDRPSPPAGTDVAVERDQHGFDRLRHQQRGLIGRGFERVGSPGAAFALADHSVPHETMANSRIPLDRYFVRDGTLRLRIIITYVGRFDRDTENYEDNIVVTANLLAGAVHTSCPDVVREWSFARSTPEGAGTGGEGRGGSASWCATSNHSSLSWLYCG
jgi:hypothetical protein